MKGLLLKDLFTLENYRKSFLFQLVLIFGFSIFVKGASTYMTVILVMLVMSAVTGTFSYDESAHWDRYATALPVMRRTVVSARYLFAFLCLVAVTLLSLLLGVGLALVMGQPDAVIGGIASTATVAAMCLLSVSVSLPIAFKLGAEKARMASTAVYIAVFLLVMLGVWLARGRLDAILAQVDMGFIGFIGAGALAGLLLLFLLSFFLSRRFYLQREF